MGSTHGVGVVGLGVIFAQYRETLARQRDVAIVAVADLDHARAQEVADTIPGCRALSVAELMADPAVDTVLNLTIPAAHAEVALAALAAGKNVYGEKPLAATLAQAQQIMAAGGPAWVGGAPDTVLGAGIQTAREIVDSGRIGRPLAATATWVAPGHEAWHPNPDFYYREGGGPLMDMGPYYLTSLVHLLGPVVSVSGASSRSRDTRTIASGPRAGEEIPVEVDTYVTGTLRHAGGSIAVPDPNMFEGDVQVRMLGAPDWESVAASAGYRDAGRGIGLIDHVRTGAGRASGALALHVLEIMAELLRSARENTPITLTTTVQRPPLVPLTPASDWR